MFGRKNPTEYEVSVQVEINATREEVFAVIDPQSPCNEMREQGYLMESDPNVEDTFLVQHPEALEACDSIVVRERKAPERLVLDVERFSETVLIGYLLSATSVYQLTSSETGGTTLDLLDRALFHPKAKGDVLQMEHGFYRMAVMSHLEKVRCFCELTPENNEHHPVYRMHGFWEWFVENEQTLRSFEVENSDLELLEELGHQLQLVSSFLSFEMRTLEDGAREFAIHADGMKEGFLTVEKLVSVAPVDALASWRIVAFKQPKGEIGRLAFVDSGSFDPHTIRYKLDSLNEYGTRDITLFFENYSKRTRNAHMEQGFFVLDHCLGEYLTATEIGEIELAAQSKAGDDTKPIASLAAEFT